MKEYIEREAAIVFGKKQSCAGIVDGGDFCNISANMLRSIPAADVVEARHGQWIRCKTILNIFKCSCCCDKFFDSEKYKYCPNCGAKMDGGIING